MTAAREAAEILGRLLPAIERALEAAVPHEGGLAVMVRYHLGWCDSDGNPAKNRTGKRIRPALVLLAAQAMQGEIDDALPAAVAVELLHNFSLIHDDIQDRSPERHGRPTVWTVWGEAQAINAGNVLHVLAHRSLAALADRRPPVGWAALQRLYDTSLRLCDGQYLDLSYEQRPRIRLDDYLTMIAGKTASLIGLALELGAMAATDDREVWMTYRQIGEQIGLAFQIWDDYLGIWGDPTLTGKPVGEDIANRKKTLPAAYAFEHAVGEDLRVLIDAYRPGAAEPAPLAAVLDVFERVGARAYTEQLATETIDRALAALDSAPGALDPLADLATLARYLVGRDR
ncbi:MAG: polyprenyl synthetase family protein [Chloroflexota bacterium]|nr:polyprenyl synthetase family protein [Dehalococcoidia bacterium]MDW8253742.1 polyprenyl synthetase family protein [Chloroflexota bacterium]